ncbi:MAG TPA: hypothetical protein VFK70_19390 [Vicinamibacteria bacterium]|nr:hypothetical protein [Vicinamibacteria bacterium]
MRRTSFALAVLVVLSCGSAYAQEEAGQFRTAISALGGLSVGSARSFEFAGGRASFGHGSGAGFAVGGGVAHDFSPRLTLEASGAYLDRNAGAWSADAGLRLNLVPSGESLVPYFAVSGGAYGERNDRITVSAGDVDLPRGFGGFPGQPGRGGRPIGVPTVRPDGRTPAVTTESDRETSGMMTLGGGVVFAAGPHVFVRPDARAQVVFSGDTRVLGLFTLNFGYRF